MVAWGKSARPPNQNALPVAPDYVDPEGYGNDPPPPENGILRPTVLKTDVLQYRGQEYHGVNPNLAGPPPDINCDIFDQTAVVPEKQEEPQRAEKPVPVRIVTAGDDWEQPFFRTTGMILSGTPITLLSHMQTRTKMTITNNGNVSILLSSEQQPQQANSVVVAAGGSFTTNGQNRIYGVSLDGSPQAVSILEEYTISAQRKPTF